MMRRAIGLLVTVTLMLVLPTRSSGGQPPGKLPRIGFLCAMSGPSVHTEAFLQGCASSAMSTARTLPSSPALRACRMDGPRAPASLRR
jgi:hypothetical protein